MTHSLFPEECVLKPDFSLRLASLSGQHARQLVSGREKPAFAPNLRKLTGKEAQLV